MAFDLPIYRRCKEEHTSTFVGRVIIIYAMVWILHTLKRESAIPTVYQDIAWSYFFSIGWWVGYLIKCTVKNYANSIVQREIEKKH